MKMNKKKVFVTALAISLVAIPSMTSLAWFSAQDSVTNNFYIADSTDNNPEDIFSFDVYEKYDSDDSGTPEEYQSGITYNNILPGDELEKDAIVKNTGHYDQYVRVVVTISDKAVWKSIVESTGADFNTYDVRQHFVGFDSSKWDLVNSTMDHSGESIQYVLYLGDILKSGESFSVFTGIKIPEAMTQEYASHFDDDGIWGFTIDVKAQAVQTQNVGDSAFEAFKTVGMAE